MSDTIFTMPGKLGDAFMQFPIPFWWSKDTGKKFTLWVDKTVAPAIPLFSAQSCVDSIEIKEGIDNYHMGGQPWHFNLQASDLSGLTVYHLGLRGFPVRQLTFECLQGSHVPVKVKPEDLSQQPCIEIEPGTKVNRLLLHGQGVCPHNRQTPTFWRFLASVWPELNSRFDEIVFAGSQDDLEVAKQAYPEGCSTFDDGADFSRLARLMADSRAVIGCGSSVVALAGALKVPCVRVHDEIANNSPKVIWDNLGPGQLNDTEIGLRKSFPGWLEGLQ